eukprot:1548740-Amphidinium_carterae.1
MRALLLMFGMISQLVAASRKHDMLHMACRLWQKTAMLLANKCSQGVPDSTMRDVLAGLRTAFSECVLFDKSCRTLLKMQASASEA